VKQDVKHINYENNNFFKRFFFRRIYYRQFCTQWGKVLTRWYVSSAFVYRSSSCDVAESDFVIADRLNKFNRTTLINVWIISFVKA